mmetsp:Transcript_17259/g.60629  ORF Transcript_17259/g.60629 Transcript_17259/m.60629 type:complete len:210 (+) Transcript_17259:910-1539(+)
MAAAGDGRHPSAALRGRRRRRREGGGAGAVLDAAGAGPGARRVLPLRCSQRRRPRRALVGGRCYGWRRRHQLSANEHTGALSVCSKPDWCPAGAPGRWKPLRVGLSACACAADRRRLAAGCGEAASRTGTDNRAAGPPCRRRRAPIPHHGQDRATTREFRARHGPIRSSRPWQRRRHALTSASGTCFDDTPHTRVHTPTTPPLLRPSWT